MSDASMAKHSLFDANNLDVNKFTLSLLHEACRSGLIDAPTLGSVQSQLISILADVILKYTKGKSTSVRADTAQAILESILYSIDAYLVSLNNIEQALDLLISGHLEELYQSGLKLTKSIYLEARLAYQELKRGKLPVDNLSYHASIDKDLPDFLAKYDPIFRAQDTTANIDYPLLQDDMSLQGILYIRQYIQNLHLENQFCHLFTPEDIKILLLNYGLTYRMDSREALINIFEIVLTNSIFAVMAGQKAIELSLTQKQYYVLLKKMQNMSNEQRSCEVTQAINDLLNYFNIEQTQMREYILGFKKLLMPRMENALNNDSLYNIAIIDNNKQSPRETLYEEGAGMDDKSFRYLISKILSCQDSQEKITIIRTRIKSLSDFLDLLEAECLFGNEYIYLYDTLGDMELSLLGRIVFMEELRVNQENFSVLKSIGITTSPDWQRHYTSFLANLKPERIESIENLIKLSL